MIQFRIVTQGEQQAAFHLAQMGEEARNVRPALEEIYLTILDIVDETFDREGARGGFAPWTPTLSPVWLRYKARHGLSMKTLEATRRLHESMSSYRHPDQYVRIEKDKIVLSSRLVRGKVHQKGSRDSSIPARPYIRFTEQDKQAFGREIARFIVRRIKRGRATGTRPTSRVTPP